MKLDCTFDHYFLYEEIVEKMKGYASKYPSFTKLTKIGTSFEKRDILLLEVTDLSTGDFSDKPAYYIEGNIHAGEVTGSMVVMHLMDVIFNNMNEPEMKKLLARYTFYMLPRVSPDGAELYLTTPETLRSSTRLYPYTDVMPGLIPKDMDQDGVIRVMRKKSPYGIWKISDKDERLMVRRKPDEDEGEFYHVYTEGDIVDYDGLSIHSAPSKRGYDFNRNYPMEWKPDWVQFGAGETPLSSPETKANADFLLSHKNIAACVDMHTHGGMILYTPGYKSSKNANLDDIEIYKEISKMAGEESGYPVLSVYDEFMPQSAPETFGGFDDFCHFILGVPCNTIECWDVERRAGIKEEYPPKEEYPEELRQEDELKLLKWVDENVSKEEGFKDWTLFQHPTLGEVEIGGINMKFLIQNPPKKFLPQECEKHVRFMLREVKTLPRLVFDEISVTEVSNDVYKMQVTIGNRGFLPTYVFKEGIKSPRLSELKVTISGATLIEGKEETKIGHLQGFSSVKTMSWGFPSISVETEPMQKKLTYVLKCEKGTKVKLKVSGGRCGKIETDVTI